MPIFVMSMLSALKIWGYLSYNVYFRETLLKDAQLYLQTGSFLSHFGDLVTASNVEKSTIFPGLARYRFLKIWQTKMFQL